MFKKARKRIYHSSISQKKTRLTWEKYNLRKKYFRNKESYYYIIMKVLIHEEGLSILNL